MIIIYYKKLLINISLNILTYLILIYIKYMATYFYN